MSSRPEFEPMTDGERTATGRSSILPWLRLMRLPNVFTAIADVAMGFLVVDRELSNPLALGVVAVVSALLYTAGMVLNDVFDVEIDRRERPFRPLPSGQIGVTTARVFGFGLLLVGMILGAVAGYAAVAKESSPDVPWRSGAIALLLAGSVLFY